MDLPGPGFSSSGPVRRAGVSVHYKTYHRGPSYASKCHLQINLFRFAVYLTISSLFCWLAFICSLKRPQNNAGRVRILTDYFVILAQQQNRHVFVLSLFPNLKNVLLSHMQCLDLLSDGSSSDCERSR